jgi:putative transposase
MKRNFITNELYHLYNQGVDNRKIFMDRNDYIRFIYNLNEFNDIRPATEFSRRLKEKEEKMTKKNLTKIGASNRKTDKSIRYSISHINIEKKNKKKKEDKEIMLKENSLTSKIRDEKDKLVKIHGFILMPGRHHLVVEQLKEGGVTLFMRKLHVGYTNAFNIRYKRKGHLFQGTFKDVHIQDDAHLAFLICYFHSNPLDFWKQNWKKQKLSDLEIKKAFKFLEKYKWSSYLDYVGKNNFLPLIDKQFLLDFFDGSEGYKEFFTDWIKEYRKNINYIEDLIIS